MKKTVVLLFFVVMAEGVGFAEERYWAEYGIKKAGMTTADTSVLEDTINAIGNFEPKKVVINKAVYFRQSRFQRLFGFSFEGKKIKDWLLRRMKSVTHQNGWTVATNDNRGDFSLGDRFFEKADFVERAYTLIHEARHSDGDGYEHVRCPESLMHVSAGSPEMDVTTVKACDDRSDGAYGYQSAFLFELYARDVADQHETGLLYNSSVARIVTNNKK
jgi:hypothetical protein